MREIKFRTWDGEKRKMFIPRELRWNKLNFDLPPMFFNENSQWNSDMVLMQFTGLHDKNGKEIYEGDVVRYWQLDFKNKPYFSSNHDRVIVWKNCGFNIRSGERFEIIGDIYSNPELLTK